MSISYDHFHWCNLEMLSISQSLGLVQTLKIFCNTGWIFSIGWCPLTEYICQFPLLIFFELMYRPIMHITRLVAFSQSMKQTHATASFTYQLKIWESVVYSITWQWNHKYSSSESSSVPPYHMTGYLFFDSLHRVFVIIHFFPGELRLPLFHAIHQI